MTERTPCANAVCSRIAATAGRCTACYQYLRRDRRDRSEKVIMASGRRSLMIDEQRDRERHLAAVGMVEQFDEPRYENVLGRRR